MRHRLCALLLCLFAWLAIAPVAEAGRTGGSMGGGSFSSHSSSSGGSYSHSYSSSGGGGGGYYYSSGSSGGGDLDGAEVVIMVIVLVVAGVIGLVRQSAMGGGGSNFFGGGSSFSSYDDGSSYPSFGSTYNPNTSAYADVTVLRIAIDARARKFVQSELARIAKVADTATAAGRALMLREVAMLLRRLRDAWVYGGAVNEPMREEMQQKAVFDRHVDDARARFMHETIRNEQGTTTTAEAPEMVVHGDQGQGLILVSIIVAAHTELLEISKIGNGDQLRMALESVSHRSADDLIAIEIVWMPSEDEDRLTSIELEAKYPAPDLIPLQGALVGKVFCAYCSGPFPGELVSCPHCGAPAAGAAAAPASGPT